MVIVLRSKVEWTLLPTTLEVQSFDFPLAMESYLTVFLNSAQHSFLKLKYLMDDWKFHSICDSFPFFRWTRFPVSKSVAIAWFIARSANLVDQILLFLLARMTKFHHLLSYLLQMSLWADSQELQSTEFFPFGNFFRQIFIYQSVGTKMEMENQCWSFFQEWLVFNMHTLIRLEYLNISFSFPRTEMC